MPANPFPRSAFIPEFSNFPAFRGHTVGLTGPKGVLGSILTERLTRGGVQFAAYTGDVTDEQAIAAWFAGRKFSHFFHFAALVPVAQVERNPLLAYQTNVVGTFNVCKHLWLNQPNCWLFHCSSSHVYRPTAAATPITEDAATEPQTFYGATKLAAEQLVATLLTKMQARYCIGRVFSFTHSRQAEPYLVPALRKKILALDDGGTLEVSNPSSVRDIQDAEQVIDVILHLASAAVVGIINIGTGIGKSVEEIALAIALALNKKICVTGADSDVSGALIADTSRLRSVLPR